MPAIEELLKSVEAEGYKCFKCTPLENFNWILRVYNELKRNGIHCMEQVMVLTDEELLKMPNIGRMGMEHVREMAKEYWRFGKEGHPPD